MPPETDQNPENKIADFSKFPSTGLEPSLPQDSSSTETSTQLARGKVSLLQAIIAVVMVLIVIGLVFWYIQTPTGPSKSIPVQQPMVNNPKP